jgi:hypothetical protein
MNALSISRTALRLALAAIVAVPLTACASRSNSSVGTRVVTVPVNNERVLLSESFDNYDPHWRQVRGQWALVDGNLLQARDDARELNAMMYFDPLNVGDAEITTEVSVIHDMPQILTAGDEELLATKRRVAGAGLVFRYQDENNFYLFRTAGEEGVVLGKVIDGQWYELANPRAVDFAGCCSRAIHPTGCASASSAAASRRGLATGPVVNVQDDSLGTGRIGLATFRSKASFTALRVVER